MLFRSREPHAPQKLSYTDEEVEAFNAMLREKLPLAWSEHGFPLASLLHFQDVNEEIAYKRKKWDAQHDSYADFGKHKRQIRVNAGPYKSYELPRVANTFASPHETLPFSQFGHVWFNFVSSDIERVRELLDGYVAGIGKDVQQGKGRWSEYIIEEVQEPFIPEKMRPVPVRFCAETPVNSRFCTWKTPYWDSRYAEMCSYPF